MHEPREFLRMAYAEVASYPLHTHTFLVNILLILTYLFSSRKIGNVHERHSTDVLSTLLETKRHGNGFSFKVPSHQVHRNCPLSLLTSQRHFPLFQPPRKVGGLYLELPSMTTVLLTCAHTCTRISTIRISVLPNRPKLVPWDGKVCLHCQTLFWGHVQCEPAVPQELLPLIP